jgi:glycosyltransferase involved in cell wall biosynthesis
MYDLAEICGVKPIRIPTLGRKISPWKDLRTVFLLWRLIRIYRPHVVHTHTSKAGLLGRFAAWTARAPVIVHTFHGNVFEAYFGPLLTRSIVLLERFLAGRSDRIIAISENLREDLVERGIAPRQKIELVPLGLDLAPFLAVEGRSGVLRDAVKAGPRDFVIGTVGRLVPIKDHDTFLRAAAIVNRRRDNTKYIIVGDGELRADLEEKAASLGLRGVAYFTGWQKNLAPLYADLDLVVLSSLNEGTPVSIIEGAAAGRPIVATRVGGIPDLIEDGWNGFLVPPENPDALAYSMLKILDDPVQSRIFACRARESVRDKYDVSRLVSQLQMLYIHLLEAKGISV